MRQLGIECAPSDEQGRLTLPPLAEGELITATIDHPDYAPAAVTDAAIRTGVVGQVTLEPGVRLTLRVAPAEGTDTIEHVRIDLWHEPMDHPSTIMWHELPIGRDGTTSLTIAPGDYKFLRLRHDNRLLTPRLYGMADGQHLRIADGENNNLSFVFHRQVEGRGRVVDADTGRPLEDIWVNSETPNGGPSAGILARRAWTTSGYTQTDKDGQYKLRFALGVARVECEVNGYVSEKPFLEFSVNADGPPTIPDIRLRALPRIKGTVRDADGKPVPRAVVRYRGLRLRWIQPVATDDNGRFALPPATAPIDEKTGERKLVHPLVAFDPYRPLAARADVRVDRSDEVQLTLEPQVPARLLADFTDEMNEWERGNASAERTGRETEISLGGQPAPEIDAARWLNIARPDLTLADLRGRYVLLDFWFTTCGPCHADFPSVTLVHELFKDKVTVIAVHDNSSSPEAVRAHIEKLGLPFPIAVDHPDGRTIARYQQHGIATGFPDYVLISPEGKVLLDDNTIPHPLLRWYKLEIIRQLLLQSSGEPK